MGPARSPALPLIQRNTGAFRFGDTFVGGPRCFRAVSAASPRRGGPKPAIDRRAAQAGAAYDRARRLAVMHALHGEAANRLGPVGREGGRPSIVTAGNITEIVSVVYTTD